MGLESGSFISDLIASNPASTDKRRFGDDHLRLIKLVLKNSFPNIAGPVAATDEELSFVNGVTSALQVQLDAKLTETDLDALIQAYGFGVLSTINSWLKTQAVPSVNLGDVAVTLTVDAAAADAQAFTLTDNVILAFNNTQDGQSLTLKAIQGGAGGFLLTWPTIVHWANKTVPILSTTTGDYDIIAMKHIDGNYVAGFIRYLGSV